jgi:hypothetical protein
VVGSLCCIGGVSGIVVGVGDEGPLLIIIVFRRNGYEVRFLTGVYGGRSRRSRRKG